MILTKPFFPAVASAFVALLVSGLFLAYGLPSGEGAVLPLDDAYIHLQYAWQASQGQFLQYNPGDTPTTGATSLLYMLLLASGFALGVSREAMPVAILVTGVMGFALTAALVADGARRLALRLGLPATGTGILAGLWFSGSGWMAWSFLSGMETGWLMLFVAGALWALLARRPALTGLCAALAALTRPEALLLALAILVSEGVVRHAGEPGRHKRLVISALPLLAVFVSPAVNWLFSSSASATGFLAKSWFTMLPFYPGAILGSIWATFLELTLRLMGGLSPDGHWHAFPLLQLWVVAGLLASRRDKPAWRTALAAVMWSGGLLASTATLQTATWHHYRYQMPAYPVLVMVGAVGVGALVARLPRRQRWVRIVVLVATVGWSATSVTGYLRAYARDTRTTAEMQMVLAAWLRDNTPPDARIVVHDVGVMRFLGERHTVDAVGLTTTGSVDAYRNGPGALYELLAQIRPDYYAVYADLAPPYFGISTAPDLLGAELFRVQLPDYSPYVSAMDTQVVTQPDWTAGALASAPQQPSVVAHVAGLSLVDALNIADLADERAHGYTWWNASRLPGFISDARRMAYRQDPATELAGGGRVFDGGQSFTLATRPSEPLVLVGRFHQTTDIVLEVRVDDEDAGVWRLPAIPGQWLESTFLVPAQFVRSGATRFTFAVGSEVAGARLSPFYFWAYQGELLQETTEPSAETDVRFGTVAQLIGHDLTQTLVAPGDTLSLGLYWRALQPPRADWHIFVHLVDPGNDTTAGIVAQWDAAPRAGTYPFWVWQAEEVVTEPAHLVLPGDLPSGEYVLLVGVYDLATGERAQVDPAQDFGANRLLLSHIAVR
jgi:hypothetical protein